MRDRSTHALPGLLLLLCAAAFALGGCGNHPDRAQCEAFADHYIELAVKQYEDPEDIRVARETAEGARGQFVNHCVDAGSTQSLNCALAATNLETYRECFPKPAKDEDAKKAAEGGEPAKPTTKPKPAPKKTAAPAKPPAAPPAAPSTAPSTAPPADAKTGEAASSEKPAADPPT